MKTTLGDFVNNGEPAGIETLTARLFELRKMKQQLKKDLALAPCIDMDAICGDIKEIEELEAFYERSIADLDALNSGREVPPSDEREVTL